MTLRNSTPFCRLRLRESTRPAGLIREAASGDRRVLAAPPGDCRKGDAECCDNKGCVDNLLKSRIKSGIDHWSPDGPGFGPYGALRWYHRWSTGANPGLAVLWQPIVDDLLKEPASRR